MLTAIRTIMCVLFSILYITIVLLAVMCGVMPMPKSDADDQFLTLLWKWADKTQKRGVA